MKRRVAVAAVAVALVAALTVFAQPRIVPLWALYVTDRAAADREIVFLDPFPDAVSCGAAASVVARSGQWASCRSRLTLAFSRSVRLAALEREFAPGGTWERLEYLCGLSSRSTYGNARRAPASGRAAS